MDNDVECAMGGAMVPSFEIEDIGDAITGPILVCIRHYVEQGQFSPKTVANKIRYMTEKGLRDERECDL